MDKDINKIDGVILTPLKKISTSGGDVYHAMKFIDQGFMGFGEAYFSEVDYRYVKPWKRHNIVTLNIVVIAGKIRFTLYDEREDSVTNGSFQTVTLEPEYNYSRLTVPPGIWMAFQGMSERKNLLLNIIDEVHDPNESDRKEINAIKYDWSLK